MTRPVNTVTTPQRRDAYLGAGTWDGTTLPQRVARHAAERGTGLAVVDLRGGRTRSWAQLWEGARRVAGFLRSVGVRPGDVVSVQLPNWYETVVVDLGVLTAGAVLNPLLPIYRERELRHVLGTSEARVLVTPVTYRGFDHAGLAETLRETVPTLEHTLAIDDPDGNADAFASWLGEQSGLDLDPTADPPAPAEAVSELIFTSGTEAQPKAIMHTEQTANFSVRTIHASLGMNADDVVWMPSPIGHSTGFNFGVRLALYHGLPLVLQDRWDATVAADLIEGCRCTYTMAATTFVNDLVHSDAARARDLSTMRLFTCGGAPVPAEVVEAAGRMGITVLRLYGSTEALVVTCVRPGSAAEKVIGTDGRPLDDIEIEVRDDDGRAVIGEPGEIWVRGPNTSVGFFVDPERTAQTYEASGWVRSGDIGVHDEDGFLTIVGRKKEIIIRGGLNIAPREIEDVVGLHPAVADVAVVGLSSERLGEQTCACVVLRDGAEPIGLAELVAFLKEQGLAAYKLPERLELLEALPRTSSGKVKKFEIVAEIATR